MSGNNRKKKCFSKIASFQQFIVYDFDASDHGTSSFSVFNVHRAAGFGLCLAEIGEMMTREFRRGEEAPSELEVLCMEARRAAAETNRETFVCSKNRTAGRRFPI
ncbi:putative 1-phosphatidylinositol 4-kinase [Helianthus annuus]|nr:putative 1-phosphatidylinositol 4-kinase [Helianthus annuus]